MNADGALDLVFAGYGVSYALQDPASPGTFAAPSVPAPLIDGCCSAAKVAQLDRALLSHVKAATPQAEAGQHEARRLTERARRVLKDYFQKDRLAESMPKAEAVRRAGDDALQHRSGTPVVVDRCTVQSPFKERTVHGPMVLARSTFAQPSILTTRRSAPSRPGDDAAPGGF